MGGAVDQVFDTVLLGLAVRLRDDGLDALTRLPGVAVVDEEVTVSSTAEQANPPSWGLDRIDQTALPLDDRYTYLSSGAGVTVYVVDSGIRPTHNEFAGRIPYGAVYDYDRLPWERWSGSVTSGFEDCASGAGHGTHVAGIVGGSTYGVAKSVTVIPVKVLDCAGNGTDTAVIAASEWIAQDAASRGPAVVVMSLGGDPSSPLDSAVRGLVNSGIPVVVAAGNTGDDACSYSPSRVGEVITVAGTTRSDRAMTSAAYGACVDIFAPGDGITSAGIASDSDSAIKSGTSMAAPHVAGIAARLLESDPTASATTIWDRIAANALVGVVSSRKAGDPDRLAHLPGSIVSVAIEIVGAGGSVEASTGTTCVSTCQFEAAAGSTLNLTARSSDGVLLQSWGGACASQGGVTCQIVPAGSTTVVANFGTVDPRDFEPVGPTRIVDTRTGAGGVPAERVGSGGPGGTPLMITVAGRAGVPVEGVAAVALNLTADQTSVAGSGYVSIYPCTSTTETPPGVSQLNFANGQTVANSVIVPVSAAGTACVFVFGRAHIIADITGWLAAGEGFTAPRSVADVRHAFRWTRRPGRTDRQRRRNRATTGGGPPRTKRDPGRGRRSDRAQPDRDDDLRLGLRVGLSMRVGGNGASDGVERELLHWQDSAELGHPAGRLLDRPGSNLLPSVRISRTSSSMWLGGSSPGETSRRSRRFAPSTHARGQAAYRRHGSARGAIDSVSIRRRRPRSSWGDRGGHQLAGRDANPAPLTATSTTASPRVT